MGFRHVCIENGQLKVNGQALTVKGVNRHEHDQVGGKVVSEASMIEDIKVETPPPIRVGVATDLAWR